MELIRDFKITSREPGESVKVYNIASHDHQRRVTIIVSTATSAVPLGLDMRLFFQTTETLLELQVLETLIPAAGSIKLMTPRWPTTRKRSSCMQGIGAVTQEGAGKEQDAGVCIVVDLDHV